ncbi:unnamed protein product [Clavelina lepadiformis]|uniref:SCP domain-containing protein n=1 Tax=Clavelina lepadiformis TaxID=159417 RepID=A0ABP0FDY8_CLALP
MHEKCHVFAYVLLSMFPLIQFSSAIRSNFTSSERTELLKAHNYYRSRVDPPASNMRRILWDKRLAMLAQDRAERCIYSHGLGVSHDELGPVGENIYITNGTFPRPKFGVNRCVQKWNSEKEDFTYHSRECKEGKQCGHYTQLVWATSHLVGCGVKYCQTPLEAPQHVGNLRNVTIVFCLYHKQGNKKRQLFGGERINKPYVEGEFCSKCPASANKCYSKLCSVDKKKGPKRERVPEVESHVVEHTQSNSTDHMNTVQVYSSLNTAQVYTSTILPTVAEDAKKNQSFTTTTRTGSSTKPLVSEFTVKLDSVSTRVTQKEVEKEEIITAIMENKKEEHSTIFYPKTVKSTPEVVAEQDKTKKQGINDKGIEMDLTSTSTEIAKMTTTKGNMKEETTLMEKKNEVTIISTSKNDFETIECYSCSNLEAHACRKEDDRVSCHHRPKGVTKETKQRSHVCLISIQKKMVEQGCVPKHECHKMMKESENGDVQCCSKDLCNKIPGDHDSSDQNPKLSQRKSDEKGMTNGPDQNEKPTKAPIHMETTKGGDATAVTPHVTFMSLIILVVTLLLV